MALVPTGCNDIDSYWDYWDHRRRLWHDWDLIDWDGPYWRRSLSRFGSVPDLSRVMVGKNGFEANIDVSPFKPFEVKVKTCADMIIIDAKHEKRRDGDSYVGRHLVKRYVLPRGYYANDVKAELSSDGVLTVKCAPCAAADRNIYVRQTGSPFLSSR